MGLRICLARVLGAVSTGMLKTVFRRPAANFPGKIGLRVDPSLIADLSSRINEGSIVVVGTNGKTTATNMLADVFERSGKSVICNRTGANMSPGVATALLHAKQADWGIFESDELWLAKILPQLKPNYVVLLNLFRDQLDRMGEISHLQSSILEALASSPATMLIYNADDPLCQAIASRCENYCIPFGVDEDLGLPQNTVSDAGMCQLCDDLLDYSWRQYGQLGSYHCPSCGFKREDPVYAARGVSFGKDGMVFTVEHDDEKLRMDLPFLGTYMLYNALAVCVAARCCGLPVQSIDEGMRQFDPHNGRLQQYSIDGRHVLLNLAKNPTGFNQNLRIITGEAGPKAVAFFINDKEADGHDVSWLWDIDFQELAGMDDLLVYAGGIRKHDMQVRLKYAGIEAQLVDGAKDFLEKAKAASPDAGAYLIANYTALPEVKSELDRLAQTDEPLEAVAAAVQSRAERSDASALDQDPLAGEKLTIVHLYPELLNLYGDGGNVTVLVDRARRRGIEVELVCTGHGQSADFSQADIVFLGGGPDREQRLASHDLLEQAEDIRAYIEDDGVLLAICGGYQILGHEWLLGDESVPGLGVVDIVTKRAKGGSHNRLVGNIVLKSELADMPVIGYENHAGRTFLGEGCEVFGRVFGRRGKGNNDESKADGVLYRNVIGTYLHGPLLAKNPEIADCLIERALARRAEKQGRPAPALPAIDDCVERAANADMLARLQHSPHAS